MLDAAADPMTNLEVTTRANQIMKKVNSFIAEDLIQTTRGAPGYIFLIRIRRFLMDQIPAPYGEDLAKTVSFISPTTFNSWLPLPN